jgi:hypothetical protein
MNVSSRGTKPLETADELAKLWHGKYTAEQLHRGVDKKIPSSRDRQLELIGITLDTVIEAIVMTRLTALQSQGPASAIKTLVTENLIEPAKLPNEKNKPFIAALDRGKIAEALEMLRNAGCLVSSNNLADKSEVIFSYNQRKEGYKEAQDPRVKAFNERFGKYCEVVDNGEKSLERSQEKESLSDRPTKDLNRVTLIARTPHLQDLFVERLKVRRAGSGSDAPESFDRGWELKHHGHMDRKVYVVLRRGFTNEEAFPHGTIAEIKIESPEIFVADGLTREAFGILRSMLMEKDAFDPKQILEDYTNKCGFGLQDESLLRQLPFMMKNCVTHYENSDKLRKTGKHTAGALKNVITQMRGLRAELEGHIQAIHPDTDAQISQEEVSGVLAGIFTTLVHLERSIYAAMKDQSNRQWRDFYQQIQIEQVLKPNQSARG